MRPRLVLVLAIVAMVVSGCTRDAAAPSRSAPSPSTSTETVNQETPAEAEIYAAVIRHLVTKDHTFGRGKFSYKVVYILDGPTKGAGRPRGDLFGSPPGPFDADVVAGIGEELAGDLPLLRFVDEGKEALRSGKRLGEVRNDGVLMALGPIERKNDRVQVPNTFWCGGKCSQWLTFVLAERNGRWVIKRTTGPVVMS